MLYYKTKALFSFLNMLVYAFVLAKKDARRSHFALRAAAAILFFSVADLFVWKLYPENLQGIRFDVLFVLYILLLVLEVFLTLLFLYREPPVTVLFRTAVSYLIMDMSGMVLDIVRLIPGVEAHIDHPAVVLAVGVLPALLWGGVLYLLMRAKQLWDINTTSRSKVIFSLCVVFLDLIVGRMRAYVDYSMMTRLVLAVYGVVVNVMAVLIMFFVMDSQKNLSLAERLRALFRGKEARTAEEREALRELRAFAHDWKNRTLLDSARERGGTAVENCGALYETGNEALDIVLGEKERICRERGISFQCMADGKLLDFLEPYDLCSLFGNALDNAIEGCSRLQEGQEEQEERGCIFLSVREKDGRVAVCLENSKREEPLALRDGMPVTEKKDSARHGYGMLSMRQICESYGGIFLFKDEGKVFRLEFFFRRR